MSTIEQAFSRLRASHEKALVPYLTAGDPSLDVTKELILSLAETGADLIEVGIPFSDPTADGPIIQRASARALKSGTTLIGILDMIERIRPSLPIPMVLFGYYNPILQFGPTRFTDRAAAAGVDGVLVVDLPHEESHELTQHTDRAGIDFITLVSPVSDGARLSRIIGGASGFLYYISVTGVTGKRGVLPPDLEGQISHIRTISDLPIVVGFGISTPETAEHAARAADGVVVGSALVEIIERHATNTERLLREVRSFTAALKAPLRPRES